MALSWVTTADQRAWLQSHQQAFNALQAFHRRGTSHQALRIFINAVFDNYLAEFNLDLSTFRLPGVGYGGTHHERQRIGREVCDDRSPRQSTYCHE
jgi:hypothetical protein